MALVGGSLSVNASRAATLNRNTPDNADSVKIMAIKKGMCPIHLSQPIRKWGRKLGCKLCREEKDAVFVDANKVPVPPPVPPRPVPKECIVCSCLEKVMKELFKNYGWGEYTPSFYYNEYGYGTETNVCLCQGYNMLTNDFITHRLLSDIWTPDMLRGINDEMSVAERRMLGVDIILNYEKFEDIVKNKRVDSNYTLNGDSLHDGCKEIYLKYFQINSNKDVSKICEILNKLISPWCGGMEWNKHDPFLKYIRDQIFMVKGGCCNGYYKPYGSSHLGEGGCSIM